MYGTKHLRRLAGALILATTPCSPGAENPPSPPNVVLIIVDDLNDWVGYLGGHPQTQTPHIDKLATRSVRFTNAHASAPLYGPSRISMFSGLYPHRTGVYGHIHDADLKKVETLRNHLLLPTLFKKHRYKTMGAGKIFHITEAAAAYLACVNFVDAQVIHALQKSPHANNTIIILTSDHGYHLGEKQRWAKHSLWERSSRVPLLIHIPNKHKVSNSRKIHHTISNPVGLIDLYPTLADLCGLKQPAQLDGISLTPLISHHSPTTKQKEPAWRHSVMTVYGRGNISLRSKQYRYIRYADGSEELYNMLQDPNEWKNLCHGKPPQKTNPVIQRFRQHIPKSFQHWPPYSYANINAWFNRDIEKSRQVTGRKQRTKYRPQKISPQKSAEIK